MSYIHNHSSLRFFSHPFFPPFLLVLLCATSSFHSAMASSFTSHISTFYTCFPFDYTIDIGILNQWSIKLYCIKLCSITQCMSFPSLPLLPSFSLLTYLSACMCRFVVLSFVFVV